MNGYVYLIGSSLFGWYKIGKSKKPDVRISDLGILLPFKVEVFAVWQAKNHHMMEKTLHDIYKKQKINGEWFHFTKPEVIEVIDSIPSDTRVYSGTIDEFNLSTFSNVTQDKKQNREVIGVRVRKLRGDFTPEEREMRKQESIMRHLLKKESASQVARSGVIKIPKSCEIYQHLLSAMTLLDK